MSVRSAFDLLLEALELERGSEVLMSAITHPDMARVTERHGLVPVPVDLDLTNLAPRPDLLEPALTPRTRAVVVAHLFGARADLAAVIAFCRRHDLVLVEDCAHAFRGPADSGDPHASISLFSFGSIKTCPALGGAIAYVRDAGVRERMRRLQNSRPAQGRAEYFLRILRFAGLLALGHPLVYELFVRAGRRAGVDVDDLVNRSVHALKPPASGDVEDRFGAWLRRRPSAPLLALLRRRLRTFDHERLRRRAARGEAAAGALPASLFHPGRAALQRSHWVFPMAPAMLHRVIDALRGAGFDATVATSSIAVIDPPRDRPELRPTASAALMERAVFLPVYPELPERAFRRLLRCLGELEEETPGGRGSRFEPSRVIRP